MLHTTPQVGSHAPGRGGEGGSHQGGRLSQICDGSHHCERIRE